MERLFDSIDVFMKFAKQSKDGNTMDCNIGTIVDPKKIKIAATLLDEQRLRYVELSQEFFDVFTWRYEYLKTYDISII